MHFERTALGGLLLCSSSSHMPMHVLFYFPVTKPVVHHHSCAPESSAIALHPLACFHSSSLRNIYIPWRSLDLRLRMRALMTQPVISSSSFLPGQKPNLQLRGSKTVVFLLILINHRSLQLCFEFARLAFFLIFAL